MTVVIYPEFREHSENSLPTVECAKLIYPVVSVIALRTIDKTRHFSRRHA